MAQGPARGIDGVPFTIGGIELVPSWSRPSQPGSLTLLKAARMVDRYRELLGGLHEPNLVELGISQGGSVALLAVLCPPAKLVAFELSPDRIEALDATLEEHGLQGRVRPHYGIDQSDRAALRAVLDEEVGDEPLDVVIDDASHLYGPTRASFDELFPRLRPGGAYVIEDWSWQDLFADSFGQQLDDPTRPFDEELERTILSAVEENRPPETPLSSIALEATLARAHGGDAIESVTVDEDWILIRRGPGHLDASFSLDSLYQDHYRVLAHA
jgi:hypothetical protein